MTYRLPEKGTLESVVIGFDFSREATAVSAPSLTCEVETSGATDDDPAAVLVDQPEVDGTNPALVLQRVAGGVDSTDYRIQCTVQTAEGNTLTCASILPVRLKL